MKHRTTTVLVPCAFALAAFIASCSSPFDAPEPVRKAAADEPSFYIQPLPDDDEGGGTTPCGGVTTGPYYDSSTVTAPEPTVTVTQVRYGGTVSSGFEAWSAAGVWQAYQDETYIAVVWDPAAAGKPVENVILLCAGQQGSSGSSDAANVMTGQKDGWKFDARSADRQLSNLSLGAQIIARNGRTYANGRVISSDNTFLALAFDAGFNYGWDNAQRGKIVQAYRAFLAGRAGPSANWKTVYLGGSSRGGTLSMRLAEFMRADAPAAAKVIVGSVDSVADYGEEMHIHRNGWGFWTYHDNPVSSNIARKGVKANLDDQYAGTSKTNFNIFMTVGGANVASVSTIHAFAISGSRVYEGGWIRQKWVNYSHTEMGRQWHSDVSADQLSWFLKTAYGPLHD